MKAGTKIEKTREVVLKLLREHEAENGLPTIGRFLFYELEQRGLAVKPDRDGPRKGMRRTLGWPPGYQDVTDTLMQLRKDGSIPWDWVADIERSVAIWGHWPSATAFMNEKLDSFRLNPWEPDEPPLILTEAKGNAKVLEKVAWEYCCPISGLRGHAGGHLRTEIAPPLEDNNRAVLYLGDYDRSGFDIEQNARRVLEQTTGRNIEWVRIGLTLKQINAKKIKPIWKVDGRDGEGRDAWECEALGQAGVTELVRQTLQARLRRDRGCSIRSVHERERAERDKIERALRRLRI
jgi:hypothetical protein